MKILTAVFFACLVSSVGYTQLSTSKLFSDHMVLQRNHAIPVWGKAKGGANVIISLNRLIKRIKADASGRWTVTLPAMTEGGPYTMKITSRKESISYTDVMLGEVWLASGQSNMEWPMRNSNGFQSEKKIAATIPVRQFMVPRKVNLVPQTELTGGDWKVADASTLADFSGVAYYYAKQLAQNLHVTVGIINSSWGGTEAEDWISRDAMAASPEFKNIVPNLPQNEVQLQQRADKRLKAFAFRDGAVITFKSEDLAIQPVHFFDNWQNGNMPGSWEWTGKLYSYRGQGFMQRTISLDSAIAAAASVLSLGTSHANATVYINGKVVNEGALPLQHQLPAGTWKAGQNSLLVNFTTQKDSTWFEMGLNGAPAELNVKFPDTTVSLADNKWRLMPDLSKPYHFDFLPNNTASALYNGMISPLRPYAIAGVIWYQGESNADRAYQYKTVFPMLITDWRNKWKEKFPFLYVQLTSFGGFQNSNTGSAWAELREAQNEALKLPNVGAAVTIDVGDPNNLHPTNKADVGNRLASTALNQVYHVQGFFQSPLFASADFTDNYATVSFTNAEQGLIVKDKYGYIRGFEIAGADHKFYYAQATIVDGNKVKVWSKDVNTPVAVRYAWTDAPVDANLYNIQGSPVSPFRSDSWKGITEGKKFE